MMTSENAAQNLQPSTLPPETEAALPDCIGCRDDIPTVTESGGDVWHRYAYNSNLLCTAKRPPTPVTKLVEDSGPRIDTSPFPPVEHPERVDRPRFWKRPEGSIQPQIDSENEPQVIAPRVDSGEGHGINGDRITDELALEKASMSSEEFAAKMAKFAPPTGGDASEGACVACEGTPTFPNLPCAVCGKPSPTGGDAGGEQAVIDRREGCICPIRPPYIGPYHGRGCPLYVASPEPQSEQPTPAPESSARERATLTNLDALCECGHKKGLHWHHATVQECGEDGCGCKTFTRPTPQAVAGVESTVTAADRIEARNWIIGASREDVLRLYEDNAAALRDLQEARERLEEQKTASKCIHCAWCRNFTTGPIEDLKERWEAFDAHRETCWKMNSAQMGEKLLAYTKHLRRNAETAEARLSALLSSVNNYRGMPPLTADMEEAGFVLRDRRFEIAVTEKEPAEVTV